MKNWPNTARNYRRILIFTGGSLGDWALGEIDESDFLIGVDSGALFLVRNGITPNLSLGDFDSVSEKELDEIRRRCESVVCYDPVMKDYTDTELAFNWAVEKRPKEIVLIGALGTRFDHSLANIHLLYKGLKYGVKSRIIGENNEIILIDGPISVTKGRFTHVSLLPFSEKVCGITLEGFQYPLDNATLSTGVSLGISNILVRETGRIFIESGQLLVIKSKD